MGEPGINLKDDVHGQFDQVQGRLRFGRFDGGFPGYEALFTFVRYDAISRHACLRWWLRIKARLTSQQLFPCIEEPGRPLNYGLSKLH